MSTEFVLIENVMYRTLLATCGSKEMRILIARCEYGVYSKRKGKVSKYSEVSNVPHVACNV